MDILHLQLAAGWSLYCLLHSVLANEGYKARLSQTLRLSAACYRVSYNVFALASLIAMLYFHFSISSPQLFESIALSSWLAPLIIIVGLTGMVMCIVKYFRQLSGIREIQGDVKPVLETTGMHKYVRHPLYISTFVFLTGLFFLQPSLSNLIALVIIVVYTVIGIRYEERKLINEFGDQYIEYRKKVPMLIPFIRSN